MRIQHNIMAMNAYRNYNTNNSALAKNLEKLSSGYKINRAGDDAAGLAISEKMRAQITGLETAQKNAKDGISLVQTAEGALTEVHDMLNRMVELADQSANGTYDNENDRAQLQKEVTALKDEINRIADSSNFNGIKLLDGSLGKGDITLDGSSTIKTGEALATNSIITDVTGALKEGTYTLKTGSLDSDGVFTEGTTSGTDQVVKISFADAEGNTTVSYVDLTDWATTADGTKGGTNEIRLGDFTIHYSNTAANTANDVIVGLDGLTVVGAATGGTAVSGDGLVLQIGDTSDDYNQMTVSINDIHTSSLGIDNIDISTQKGAQDAVDLINEAINTVSDIRGGLGAIQNRLDHTMNNLSVMTENIQDAESSIRDTDVAEEMMAYTKNNILIQSAQAMLAQANQVPQGVLQLLQ